VYGQSAALSSAVIGRLIRKALQAVAATPGGLRSMDVLPPYIAAARRFPPLRWALQAIHAPRSMEDASAAKRRLVFEEFFVLAAATAMRRGRQRKETGPDLSALRDEQFQRRLRDDVAALLPFALTAAQQRCIADIMHDMTAPFPMNRLLQGDVGCGKTAVAAAAVMLAARAGYQAAFMAPTEILAYQQYHKLSAMLSPAGMTSALLVGALKRSSRDDIVERLRSGALDFVVGTHALLSEDVAFAKLGLAVIDEQHRFGVLQRAALRAKAKQKTPHTLIMTATPIPRTLAQSVYADLDVSVIDELPPGRRPVKTYVRSGEDKAKIFAFVRAQVEQGRQAFIVCPAVDESQRALHSAVRQAQELKGTEFAKQRVALLHGRMSAQQKDEVMRLFAAGFVQILIATSVVEVGLDVPNATVMVVLDAQCFGLAQLHQLRGRIGRGTARSYCILVSSAGDEAARLGILAATNDGFAIAEEDLKLRGSGDLSGTRQHGEAELKLAHLIRDFPVFLEAKKEAAAVIAADPELSAREHAGLAAALSRLGEGAALRITS
jgi:ATP-dependent DNA helicase RecG